MKLIITNSQIKLLKRYLNEADQSYHLTGNRDSEVNINKPYYSDNIVVIDGRGTGHFGSGTYFSTYKNENSDLYKRLGQINLSREEPFKKINGGIYLVDFDYYNLYKPRNSEHAELLFKTLKLINSLASVHGGRSDFSDSYTKLRFIQIKNNLNRLSLKTPTIKEFIRMFNEIEKKYKDKTLEHYGSLSTRFIEYNGYNGVNVNNIEGYDNTLHGSVIYDLTKTINPSDRKGGERYTIDLLYNKDRIYEIIESINKNKTLFFKYLKNVSDINIKKFNFIFKTVEKYLPFRYIEYNYEDGSISKDIYNYIRDNIYPRYIVRMLNDKNFSDYKIDDIKIIINNTDKILPYINDEDIIYDILADISRHRWAYDKGDVINFVRKIKTNDISNKEMIDEIIKDSTTM